MSGITIVEKSGEDLPLSLQFPDGTSSGVYPRVYIYDDNRTSVTTVDLTHVANGLWQKADPPYTMPASTKYITCTYIVYTNAGHTTESDIYLRDIDIFYINSVNEALADEHTATPETDSIHDVIDRIDLKGNFL